MSSDLYAWRHQNDELVPDTVVGGIALLDDNYYIVDGSSNTLQRSNDLKIWGIIGDAFNVIAIAAFNRKLYVVSNNALWERGRIGPRTGNDWKNVGDAKDVTSMAAHGDGLYVTSNNKLWKRGEIGPGAGNDWTSVGDAKDVTAMASFKGSLYVASNGTLWQRGQIGPSTGNDWIKVGNAVGVKGLVGTSTALIGF